MRILQNLALVTAALSGLSVAALANGGPPEPGSLLVFTHFEADRGEDTYITVTNTNGDHTPTTGTLEAGTVDVEYVYVNGLTCFEFNRTRRLTPNDTITVSSRLDNPSEQEGYVYVFAKSPTTGQAISWNHLIGIERMIEAAGRAYDLHPYVFKAVGAQGSNTDLNGDHLRNFDGVEYATGPDVLLFPRFVGQDAGDNSQLTLLNLTGAGRFTAIVDILAYNDNEEVFSAQYSFICWVEVALADVSGIFTEAFLESSNNNVNEQIGSDEYGWFSIDGNIAFSSADSELDPLILGSLAEFIDGAQGGNLPFVTGSQSNGELLSHSIFHP
jgi:hypothetical protein